MQRMEGRPRNQLSKLSQITDFRMENSMVAKFLIAGFCLLVCLASGGSETLRVLEFSTSPLDAISHHTHGVQVQGFDLFNQVT